MTPDQQGAPTVDTLTKNQLMVYAKELREHVQSERSLREELESQNQQLEQRVREITALNQLFQKHLDERAEVVRAYREVLQGLRELVEGSTALEEWARALPVPDLDDLPKIEAQEGTAV